MRLTFFFFFNKFSLCFLSSAMAMCCFASFKFFNLGYDNFNGTIFDVDFHFPLFSTCSSSLLDSWLWAQQCVLHFFSRSLPSKPCNPLFCTSSNCRSNWNPTSISTDDKVQVHVHDSCMKSSNVVSLCF